MEHIGSVVVAIIMVCAVIGGLASILKPESGLGKEFNAGLHSIGVIFPPVAGVMAAIPYLSLITAAVFGPVFNGMHADPAMAATTVIAIDMGGYQLAHHLAQSTEGWVMAMITGFMAGPTIIFLIPLGLAMVNKSNHKYLAMGFMCGLATIPVGVLVSCLILYFFPVSVRPDIATSGAATYLLKFSISGIAYNMVPLIIFCAALVAALKAFPNAMVKIFLLLGRIMYGAITLVLIFSIVEYFTGFFSYIFGSWGFDPIIADKQDQFRALEIAGYIGLMLAGAFPMVYMLDHLLQKPMAWIGKRLGLSAAGTTGVLGSTANGIAMFRLIQEMPPKDKVANIAYAVCAAAAFGDHLAFAANFQPTLILPVLLGKVFGGVAGFLLALRFAKTLVPHRQQVADQML